MELLNAIGEAVVRQLVQQLQEQFEPVIEKGVQAVKERLNELSIQIIDEYLPQWIDMVKRILRAKNVKSESFDILTKEDLINIARKYMVSGCDSVAAFRQAESSEIFIHLTYCTEKELLPEENNCYVIIQAKSLDNEINDLFNESDLIILK